MPYNPEKHHRRSIRLKGYDYSQHGAYFVTLCTSEKELFFQNSDIKQIAEGRWMWLREQYDYVEIDEWVVMPNHLHAIVIIGRGSSRTAPTKPLGRLIGVFKTTSAKLIHQVGYPHFAWQRNYYEHIIRNEKELTRIREYIRMNPLKWQFDRENPESVFALDYRKQWEWLEGKEAKNR